MKKLFGLTIVSAALVFTGCGEGDTTKDAGTDTTTGTATETDTTTAPPADGATDATGTDTGTTNP